MNKGSHEISNKSKDFSHTLIQPILTLVLIGIVIVFGFQLFSSKDTDSIQKVQEIYKEISFDNAMSEFMNNEFGVYIRGSLYLKTTTAQGIEIPKSQTSTITTIPSTQMALYENKYNDFFFYIKNGKVLRVDIRTYGKNESLFINKSGDIVFLNNTNKKYSIYKAPSQTDTNAVNAFKITEMVMQEQYIPLIPLLKDYSENKFKPTQRAVNIYTGQWQHNFFTNNDISTVVINTDPLSGVFDRITFSGTNPASVLGFDFTKVDKYSIYDQVPADYTEISVKIDSNIEPS